MFCSDIDSQFGAVTRMVSSLSNWITFSPSWTHVRLVEVPS
jgi:hypothetical protein